MHRQAVLVFFAIDVQFHQMPRKLFTSSLRLGTVCKCAVQAQRAINKEDVHEINSQEFRFSTGNVHCIVLLPPSREAILGAVPCWLPEPIACGAARPPVPRGLRCERIAGRIDANLHGIAHGELKVLSFRRNRRLEPLRAWIRRASASGSRRKTRSLLRSHPGSLRRWQECPVGSHWDRRNHASRRDRS